MTRMRQVGTNGQKRIVASYLRVAHPSDGVAAGLDRQRLACDRARRSHNLQECVEFSDRGASGLSADRPGLLQLLDLVRQGRVSHLVVAQPSRLARRPLVLATVLGELRSHDVAVLLADEGRGTVVVE